MNVFTVQMYMYMYVSAYRETLQLGTFHYIIQLTATYYESMVLEKRDLPVARQWAQRCGGGGGGRGGRHGGREGGMEGGEGRE